MDFALETVAPLPLAFSAYHHPVAPGYGLRRAVFRKEYVVIYGVSDTEAFSVIFHHTSRGAPDMSFLQA